MQQFETSIFHTIVFWHELGEVESECTLHNFIVLAIFMPKIIKFSKNMTKLWQKQFWLFFSETQCSHVSSNSESATHLTAWHKN